jgi:cysteine-rich repeat protein
MKHDSRPHRLPSRSPDRARIGALAFLGTALVSFAACVSFTACGSSEFPFNEGLEPGHQSGAPEYDLWSDDAPEVVRPSDDEPDVLRPSDDEPDVVRPSDDAPEADRRRQDTEVDDTSNAPTGNASTSDNPSTPPECGNDIVEEGEECDGPTGLVGEACLEDCTLDRSVYCPDGTITHRMPHNNLIWKENNTPLTRIFGENGTTYENLEIIETRTFCVDLALSDGDSVYLQAVNQWGEELGGGRVFSHTPMHASLTMDITPPPGSAVSEQTSEGESPLVGYAADTAPASGVWRVHLRDWSSHWPVIQAWGREDVAYDVLVQVVEDGAPFDPSQGVERTPVCGDGEIHLRSGEQCDDANSDEEDGCRSDCTIDTEMLCPGGVLDMIYDDPMYENGADIDGDGISDTGLDNVPGIYGYEDWLDFPTETRVHCVPVPHDQAIRFLQMKIYEDNEANGWGTLKVTPPAGSGITSQGGDNEVFGCCGITLTYRNRPLHNYDFNVTQGGVWIHSMTGAVGGYTGSPDNYYWEFKWWFR